MSSAASGALRTRSCSSWPSRTSTPEKRQAIYESLGLINEQLWLGHFEMWSGSGLIVFRHATILDTRENDGLTLDQAGPSSKPRSRVRAFLSRLPVRALGAEIAGRAIAAALIDTHGEA